MYKNEYKTTCCDNSNRSKEDLKSDLSRAKSRLKMFKSHKEALESIHGCNEYHSSQMEQTIGRNIILIDCAKQDVIDAKKALRK